MSKLSAKELLQKYKEGTCTEEEKALIETWYNRHGVYNPTILSNKEREEDVNAIGKFLDIEGNNERRLWPGFAAAALIIATLSVGFFFLSKQNVNHQESVQKLKPQHDISPGGNKAFLTLSDGTRVSLNDAANGEIAKQAGIIISKTVDGRIVYATGATALSQGALPVYNTVETPKGGQFQILLPDGSKVWLNAASSLRYPVVFSGEERNVELKGEAYFEIVKNKKMPFNVKTPNGMEIQVLGTHFNVMAYEDENNICTTLLEGSVNINHNSSHTLLKPGQQALLNKNSRNITVSTADMEEAMAWKNGYFLFNDENIESVMRKISRWYDVEVEYHGNMEKRDFTGSVSRFENVSKVLNMLELTGIIHFKVEGRRILVMP